MKTKEKTKETIAGRIVEIEKYQVRATYVKQGVPYKEQWKYGRYNGGHGTYVVGGEYLGTRLDVKIYFYDLDKSYTINVYEDVLNILGKKKLSGKMLDKITENNEGKKVKLPIYLNGDAYVLILKDSIVLDGVNTIVFDPEILLKEILHEKENKKSKKSKKN